MRRVWTAVLLLSSVACAKRWRPADPSVLASGRGRSIGVVSTEPGQFWARTIFDNHVMAWIAMAAEGSRIVKKHHLVDPSSAIASRLMMELAHRYALVPRTPRPIAGAGQKVRWDTDLYLQVKTEHWAMDYFLDDWAHYRLVYETSVELRDGRTDRLLASGQCQSNPEETTTGASYDEMLADEAALLKKRLADAAAACTQVLSRDLFAIKLPEDPIPDPVPVDRRSVYATCQLEETPAWKAAGPAERHRMLDECWSKRAPPAPQVQRVAPAAPYK
jgi:hypothetical protein